MSVYLFVCLFICVIAKHPLLGVVKTSGQRTIKSECVFTRMLKHSVSDQPTVDVGGVTKGRSVTVGCWLFALQGDFNITSMALQWHLHGTSMVLQQNLNRKKKCVIIASIVIGREIECLSYAGERERERAFDFLALRLR